jgi:alpha-D-ribose 1-methylphosphonate 5-triphosphate synthase subunit PhnG
MEQAMTYGGKRGEADSPPSIDRQTAMALLAAADGAELLSLAESLAPLPEVEDVRRPETGLVMVQGRIGGGGAAFNLGEATVTRASVRLSTGEIGHAYALGTDRDKARLAAIIDALWQRDADRATIDATVLVPLANQQAERDAERRNETAATRVNFFTMVRGDD